MEHLIRLRDVGKKYGKQSILQEVSLDINRGDSIAFIGHNGCGKSTLLKIIGKLETYQEGCVVYRPNITVRYVPEHFPKLSISAYQYINNMALILGMNKEEAQKRTETLFEQFYMKNMMDTSIKKLSKGSQQKVAVIQALLTKSDVLLLDEPLSGQDSDSQKRFVEMVKELNHQGTAVIMSCHEEWLTTALSKDIYVIEDQLVQKRLLSESKGEEE